MTDTKSNKNYNVEIGNAFGAMGMDAGAGLVMGLSMSIKKMLSYYAR